MEGVRVALVSRSQANLDAAATSLAGGGKVVTIAADLTDADAAREAVRRTEEALGPVDVLVNSAGAAKRYLPEELTAAAWHAAMDAKYFTYIHAMDAILPGMAARGRGVVVNIIGSGGKVANPIHLPGGAANSALMLATAGLAQVYAPKGVRIAGINPGATMTERVKEGLAVEAKLRGISPEEALAQGQARVPLRRYAAPEDIANAVLFLASDNAAYITGTVIPMDGGANAVI
jgi:NAD(P)-dependent dehydrogenase (short-subunit alcohol dehydrogenase family)